jgi:drug/metabolite transporter (DMT)-like permease
VALVCLSQASVIIRWSGTDPLLLGAWRLLVAGLVLLVWSQRYLPEVKLRSRDFKKVVAAGFAFFVHLFSYAYAAHNTSISHLMLIFSVNPVTTALGSWLFFKEKMSVRQGFAYLLALVGIYVLAHEKQGTGEIFGDLVAIVAAITFSIYALLSKWARHDLPNSVFASRMYLAGAGFFFLTAILSGIPLMPEANHDWVGIGLLALFPTLLGHGIFTMSMKYIPLYILSLGKLLEPAMAALTAFLLFGEKLSLSAMTSFVLIVSAVILVIIQKPQGNLT